VSQRRASRITINHALGRRRAQSRRILSLITVEHLRHADGVRQADQSAIMPAFEFSDPLTGVLPRRLFILRLAAKPISLAADIRLSVPVKDSRLYDDGCGFA